jgi:hypothetical protein
MDLLGESMNRLTELERIIRDHSDHQSRRELELLLANCRGLMTQASREAVECRRHGHRTPTFIEIENKLGEALDNLDRWVTFAKLLYN